MYCPFALFSKKNHEKLLFFFAFGCPGFPKSAKSPYFSGGMEKNLLQSARNDGIIRVHRKREMEKGKV
jgi:hypothetical protein